MRTADMLWRICSPLMLAPLPMQDCPRFMLSYAHYAYALAGIPGSGGMTKRGHHLWLASGGMGMATYLYSAIGWEVNNFTIFRPL